jgi:DNA-binding beta-propeller fold protein YncE
VGFAPRSIVVTPDGRKAYVSSEQPIPTGQIAIIDLLAKPYPRLEAEKIDVPSPQGMAIRGRRLYVATQSGANHDAVFVVDTATDRILDWIPGFAVGEATAIAGTTGNRLYVTRGNFPLSDDPGKSPLGVLDISGRRLTLRPAIPLDFDITLIAVTEDGRTVLVVNGRRLTAVDAVRDQVRLSVALAATPAGIAISRNRVYAWIPDTSQLFTFDLRSLLPGTSL